MDACTIPVRICMIFDTKEIMINKIDTIAEARLGLLKENDDL